MKRYISIILFILFVSSSIFAQNSKNLYEQGLEAFKSKNYGSAELLFRKVIDNKDQYSDNAWYYMSLSIFHQKKYTSAIFEFNRFLINCSTTDLCNKTRFWIAECYFYQNEHQKALEEYKRFISINKNQYDDLIKESYIKIGKIYFRQQRYAESVIEWKKSLNYINNKTQEYEVRLSIGNALYYDKNYQSALRELNVAVRSGDSRLSSNAYLIIGKINYDLSNYSVAYSNLSRIRKEFLIEESFKVTYYYNALCLLKLDRKNDAIIQLDNFLKVSEKNNYYYEALYLRSVILKDSDPNESLKILTEIFNESKSQNLKNKISIEIALIYIDKRQLNNAHRYLENVQLVLNNDNSEIYQRFGEVYLSLGNYEKAEEIYYNLLEKYKNGKEEDKYQFFYSLVFLKKGDYSKASVNFSKIKEINPFSIYINESNFYIAKAEYEKKNYSKALSLLNEYVKNRKCQQRLEAYRLLLKGNIASGNYSGAQAAITYLIRNYSRKEDISLDIFLFRKYLKTANKSYSYYEKLILNRYPNSQSAANVYKEYALSNYNRKNYKRSEYYFQKYLSIVTNDKDPAAFIMNARAIFLQKDYDKTIYFLKNEKLTVYDEQVYTEILLMLGKSYYYSGDFENAYKNFTIIKDKITKMNDAYTLFSIYLNRKMISESIVLLDILKPDKELYLKSIYDLANYYRQYSEYSIAEGYYNEIIKSSNNTKIKNLSYYELALIYYESKDYNKSLSYLKNVNQKEILIKSDLLKAKIYFDTNQIALASDIIKKNINNFVKEPEGEDLLKVLIVYYSDSKNINMINFYSNYLVRNYKGTRYFVNNYKAIYYFDKKNYRSAYNYYYKNTISQNVFTNISKYNTGLLSLYLFNRKKTAISYFEKMEKVDEQYYYESRILLAELYFETGKREESKNILTELISNNSSVKYTKQAQNLFDYYSF